MMPEIGGSGSQPSSRSYGSGGVNSSSSPSPQRPAYSQQSSSYPGYNQQQPCVFVCVQNNLHDPNQSGFKAAHSTETALLAVTEQLHAARSAKLSKVLILLNLSAAFDTVNHKTINPSKTELLVIPGDPSPAQDLAISLNNSMISPSATAHNLGVTMDNHLSFSSHVTNVTRSCRFLLYNIRRIRPFLSTQATQKGDEETRTQAKVDGKAEGVAEESSSKEKERKKRTRRGTRDGGEKGKSRSTKQHIHPEVSEEAKKKRDKKDPSQPSVSQRFENKTGWKDTDPRSLKIDAAIIEIIAIDNQPFSLASDVGLKRLMSLMEP
ncbi:hypothetical protein QTP86_002099, partial [Hemibagrus guttatus]